MRVDPNYLQGLSASISQSTATEATLTTELSSGLRVQSASDDPTAAAQALHIASQLSRDSTFVQSATQQTGVLQVTDSALAEVVTQLTSAISLATQATNGTLTTAQQGSIAQQLQGIQSEMLSLANTSYQGQFLFAGSKGSTTPYTLDATGNALYAGDTVQQTVKTPGGQSIPTNLPGSSIFSTVFAALSSAISGLQSSSANLSPANLSAANTAALTTALSTVSTQRSILGNSLSRLTASSTYSQTEMANLQSTQSTLVSADTVQVATDLKNTETQHTAMLSLMAALSKGSLFDYLK